MGARIAQLVESLDLQSVDRASKPAGFFLVWDFSKPLTPNCYRVLITTVKKNGGPNLWIIRAKITPRLFKIHLSPLENCS